MIIDAMQLVQAIALLLEAIIDRGLYIDAKPDKRVAINLP